MEKLLITFQTDKEMYELIRKEAYEKNISNSEVIRRACNQYFETKELEVREVNNGRGETN